jgi:hypothetical protein
MWGHSTRGPHVISAGTCFAPIVRWPFCSPNRKWLVAERKKARLHTPPPLARVDADHDHLVHPRQPTRRTTTGRATSDTRMSTTPRAPRTIETCTLPRGPRLVTFDAAPTDTLIWRATCHALLVVVDSVHLSLSHPFSHARHAGPRTPRRLDPMLMLMLKCCERKILFYNWKVAQIADRLVGEAQKVANSACGRDIGVRWTVSFVEFSFFIQSVGRGLSLRNT